MLTAQLFSNLQPRPAGHYLPPLPHTSLPNKEALSASAVEERRSAGVFASLTSASAERKTLQALPDIRLTSSSVPLHAMSVGSETLVVNFEDSCREELLLDVAGEQYDQLPCTLEADKGNFSPVVSCPFLLDVSTCKDSPKRCSGLVPHES